MKKLFKEAFFWSIPFIALIFILFFINIIKKDFIYGHYLHSTYKPEHNWFYDFSILPLKKFYIKLKNNNKEYLPQIKLYVSEANLNYFLSDLPNSSKVWQKGKIIHDLNKDKLKNIQIRLRGDNPDNWLLEKQSFRIKLRKKEMHGRYRYYNYLPFQERLLISNRMALNAKILAPKVRPVEILVNEEKKGLYLEVENFNENFLRRNQVMPVNFYKGENYNQETKIGLDSNLYNNSGLWSKEAYFNFKDKDNNDDLKRFLNLLKKAKSDPESLKSFLSYIDEDYFGRYLAYIIISQNYHVSKFHNNRIILDPWKGQVFPVIVDPDSGSSINKNFDYSSNDLTAFLNQNSKFLHLKYKYLFNFLYEEKLFDKEINYLESIQKDIVKVLKKDPIHVNLWSDIFKNRDSYNLINQEINKLKKRRENIIAELNKTPEASWKIKDNKISIIVDGEEPINNIEIVFDEGKEKKPKWVFIDENYNNRHDSNEKKFFIKKNIIKINASLYSNRINLNTLYSLKEDNITFGSTRFDLIMENEIIPSKINVKNNFLKNFFSIKRNDNKDGGKVNLLNRVIYKNKLKENFKILSGKVSIKKNKVFESPIKIESGTVFYLDEGANIIFKNKVEAIGSKEKKIKFINSSSTIPWGTIALLGDKTSGSKFENVELRGGSGGLFDQYIFTSMLSIHNTSNIDLKNIDFYDNKFFDDMLHIIYSNNIKLENLFFKDAYGDSIDIDLSKNILISNSNFHNSANDGIDLMESDVIIKKVNITKSKDKGISIGESSVAKIFESNLRNNKIGVAVKDNSKVSMSKINFLDNHSHIEAYRKNLQYGSGGKAKVTKSIFNSDMNQFLSNDSEIIIKDSIFNGKISSKGKNILIYER